jgi:hypothetical protein
MIITTITEPTCSECLMPMELLSKGRKGTKEKLVPVKFACASLRCGQKGKIILIKVERHDAS